MERAKAKLIEANRAAVLDAQLTNWSHARHLDTYLDAVEAVVEQIEDPSDGVAAGEWLAWARENAKALDPLTGRLAMPDNPEPTYSALEPHMERGRGWSGVWSRALTQGAE